MKRRIVIVAAVVACALLAAGAAGAATDHRAAPNKPLSIEAVKAANEARLLAIDGVVGVGIGERDGTPVIDVYLANDTPVSSGVIPNTIDGYPVDVSVTGPITAQPGGAGSSEPGSPGTAPGSPGQSPGGGSMPPVDTPPAHVAGAPDIIGSVDTLNVADGSWNAGIRGSFLIVGKIQNGTSVDKAFVTVTDKTRIYVQTAQGRRQVDFSYLGVGQTVAMTFTGPVAESYPVQATAGTIVIIK
jgi:hypothetical protein